MESMPGPHKHLKVRALTVFVWRDRHVPSLQLLYDSPYFVLWQSLHHFSLKIGDKMDKIRLLLLACHIFTSSSSSSPPPPSTQLHLPLSAEPPLLPLLSELVHRARICKRFWSSEIDSKESIQPAYVPGEPVRQIGLSYRPARREIDSWAP